MKPKTICSKFNHELNSRNSYLIKKVIKNMSQNDLVVSDESIPMEEVNGHSSSSLENTGDEDCSCNKKQCMLGIASIAIGLGGFALALLL